MQRLISPKGADITPDVSAGTLPLRTAAPARPLIVPALRLSPSKGFMPPGAPQAEEASMRHTPSAMGPPSSLSRTSIAAENSEGATPRPSPGVARMASAGAASAASAAPSAGPSPRGPVASADKLVAPPRGSTTSPTAIARLSNPASSPYLTLSSPVNPASPRPPGLQGFSGVGTAHGGMGAPPPTAAGAAMAAAGTTASAGPRRLRSAPMAQVGSSVECAAASPTSAQTEGGTVVPRQASVAGPAPQSSRATRLSPMASAPLHRPVSSTQRERPIGVPSSARTEPSSPPAPPIRMVSGACGACNSSGNAGACGASVETSAQPQPRTPVLPSARSLSPPPQSPPLRCRSAGPSSRAGAQTIGPSSSTPCPAAASAGSHFSFAAPSPTRAPPASARSDRGAVAVQPLLFPSAGYSGGGSVGAVPPAGRGLVRGQPLLAATSSWASTTLS